MSDLSTAERKSKSAESLENQTQERRSKHVHSNSVHNESTHEAYAQSSYPYRGEVSLIDVVLILLKHQKVMWITLIFFVVSAFVLVMLAPKAFRYSSVIEVGSYLSQNNMDASRQYQLIETSDQVVSQLNKRFLQQELLAYVQANPELGAPSFQVIASPNSNVIEIGVDAHEKTAPDILGIMNGAIAGLLANHQVKFTDARERVLQGFYTKGLEINEMQSEVQSLNQGKEVYVESLLQVEADVVRLDQQINALNKNLSILENQRGALLSDGKSNAAVNALILLNSSIEKSRLLLSQLTLEKGIELSDKKSQLQRDMLFIDKKLKNTQAKLANAQATLARLKQPMGSLGGEVESAPSVGGQLEYSLEDQENTTEENTANIMGAVEFDQTFYSNAYIRPTRVVVDPHQSIEPQSLSVKATLVMAFLVGTFSAIIMGLISEFWERVVGRRRQLSEKNQLI